MFDFSPDQSNRVRVKICGITNEGDACAAIECGADAVGFNFWPGSKRYVDVGIASSWIRNLPGEVSKIAVLVDPTWEQAVTIGALSFIDGLQLHGSEPADFCRRLAEQNIVFAKAVPVYETFAGWAEDISEARKIDDLPRTARDYVAALEEMIGAPISAIGVGPGRDETITVRDLLR